MIKNIVLLLLLIVVTAFVTIGTLAWYRVDFGVYNNDTAPTTSLDHNVQIYSKDYGPGLAIKDTATNTICHVWTLMKEVICFHPKPADKEEIVY